MRLVLDASVVVAATRPQEPSYAVARARVARCQRGEDLVVVPALFFAEVGGALARRGVSGVDLKTFIDDLTRLPHEVVTIGAVLGRRVRDVAIAHKLRGADATYVWLAMREQLPLCTLDQEMAAKTAGACQVIAP